MKSRAPAAVVTESNALMMGAAIVAARPKNVTANPVESPLLLGYHCMRDFTGVRYPVPNPTPITQP